MPTITTSAQVKIRYTPRYYYNKRKQCRGCVVALYVGDAVMYGWSLCDSKDTYKKKLALNIALGRAISGDTTKLPFSLEPSMSALQMRVVTAEGRRASHENLHKAPVMELVEN